MKRSQEYLEANDKVTEMNTLSACLNKAIKDGFVEDFKVVGRGLVGMAEPDKYYKPEEVSIPNFYRFEGDSDPGDMSILYTIETSDGRKGTLLDAYGTYADGTVNAFITQVHDIHKHVQKPDRTKEIPDASSRI